MSDCRHKRRETPGRKGSAMTNRATTVPDYTIGLAALAVMHAGSVLGALWDALPEVERERYRGRPGLIAKTAETFERLRHELEPTPADLESLRAYGLDDLDTIEP